MKILLVEPDDRHLIGLSFGGLITMEPMALELLAGSVPEHEVLIVDLRLDSSPLEYYLQTFRPDLVGVTGVTALHTEMNKILKQAKLYGALTVTGGPHASFVYNELEADIVVIGEGEGTFRELIRTLVLGDKGIGGVPNLVDELGDVPNLVIRSNGGYTLTQRQQFKLWPFPRLAFARDYKYGAFGRSIRSVEATRGCPHRCSFCVTPELFQGRYRIRELQGLVDYIVASPEPMIMFPDSNFLAAPKFVNKLLQRLKSAKVDKQYGVVIRADDVVDNPDMIKDWSDFGLVFAFIGYEGYTQEQLDLYGKGTTLDINQECVSILNRYGVISVGTLIVRPEWTKKDFDEVLSYARKLRGDVTLFSVLTPYPGTSLSLSSKLVKPYIDFDVLHAVTETALPYVEFQKQLGRISRKILLSRSVFGLFRKLIRRRFLGRKGISILPRLLRFVREVGKL